ncbi:MAG: General stress protein 69 [Nitrospira sp.]|nr:General stress protein 69 [Nitrospira sp.]
MQYRRLGNSGLQVSVIGLGGTPFGSTLDEAATARVVGAALDLGVNVFDASAAYGNGKCQEYVGRAVASRRSEVVLSARLAGGPTAGTGPNERSLSRLRVTKGVEDALRRFDTDYIDLFEAQPPLPTSPDTMAEMLRTFDDLVSAGKVRYVGASNYPAWQLVEAQCMARAGSMSQFVAIEAPYSLLNRAIERDFVPACSAYGVGIIPYSPLAGGFLTGKYHRGEPVPEGVRGYNNPNFSNTMTERNFSIVEGLSAFAKGRGHTVGELALAWLCAQPQVSSVIAGATKAEQVAENVKAADWALTADDLAAIDKLTLAG